MKNTVGIGWHTWLNGRYWIVMIFAIMSVFHGQLAVADNVEKARQYYDEGKYKKAGKLWKKIGNRKKERGEAHYQLAELYKNGQGYEKSFVKAAQWYRKSAEKNYIPAMHALGALHYRDGDESVKSTRGAILWWERAAKAGHKGSLLELANLYLNSDERNILTAKQYGRLAALAGEPAGIHVIKRVENELKRMNILGARRLANIAPNLYTIEISSFLAFYQAWEFVVLNNIKNARIHRNIYSDFVVTLGEYQTSDDTFTAISQLPDSLIAIRPRPRELRVIHRELIPSKQTFAEGWVYQRDANRFTVTLYTADARLDALDFVDEHGLEQAAIYHSKLGQWNVVAGIFTQAAEAQSAIKQLPQKMKEFGPVVNSFNALHNDMMVSRSEIQRLFAQQGNPEKITAKKPVKNRRKPPTKPSAKSMPVADRNANATTGRDTDSNKLLAADEWLFNANLKPYSLQLVTVSAYESILPLFKKNQAKLGSDVHLFGQKQPKYFYLLHGDFASSDEAKLYAKKNKLRGALAISIKNHRAKRCRGFRADANSKSEYNRFCK